MKTIVVLLILAVANEALSRKVNRTLGRRLQAPATMRANNMHYNLTVSNMADLAAAGNPVCGWPWVGANNQVWDVQLHPDNGAYNASAMNKWTFRSMSGGGHHYFYLAAAVCANDPSLRAWAATTLLLLGRLFSRQPPVTLLDTTPFYHICTHTHTYTTHN